MQMGPYLPRHIPEPIAGLIKLALDVRWSWQHGADRLWRSLDPELWSSIRNPWLLLNLVSDQRLSLLAEDKAFVELLQEQLQIQESHFEEDTWFSRTYPQDDVGQVAYFSMEFGLTESLPIYSGGLGVLAGDFLKSCSDMGVHVIGIGLLYQQGYFRQALNTHGEQIEFYPYNDPTMLPISPLRDACGEWVSLLLQLPGRPLHLRTWHVRVGRRSLLLLDSNDPRNEPGDRGITSELYGGNNEKRLQQELVLGIGGWRLLETLKIRCSMCHINEGHAAFAILERIRHYMEKTGTGFEIALRATRATNLFTTHTAVAAGFDAFSPELIHLYLQDYASGLGISVERLLALGRENPFNPSEDFKMAFLALRGSGAVNAVSRLHQEVSQHLFQPLYPRWPVAQVPIGYVTNGVHTPTWDSVESDQLWTQACGKARWRGEQASLAADIHGVADEPLWAMRTAQRGRLIDVLRKRLVRQHCERGQREDWGRHCGLMLDKDTLTLGFARRFAEYKRPDLLLYDPARLLRILNNRDRPVQLIIAGKAHPRDLAGKKKLQRWFEFVQRPEVEGKVVLIEDYDMEVGAAMTQGVDLWVNTPRRPWEACGTSGMKVLVNGGLNVSTLDGWWAEAYRPEVGWALGDSHELHASHFEEQDAKEAEQLYRLLEERVVSLFYERDAQGLPRNWIAMMRESMATLTPAYSGNRMVRDYVDHFYVPMKRQSQGRSQQLAQELEHWYQELREQWHLLHFGNVSAIQEGDQYLFTVQVYLNGLPRDAVKVQMYADVRGVAAPTGTAADTTHSASSVVDLVCTGDSVSAGHLFQYQGRVAADRPLEDYTARIVPYHPEAIVPLEAPLILWHH